MVFQGYDQTYELQNPLALSFLAPVSGQQLSPLLDRLMRCITPLVLVMLVGNGGDEAAFGAGRALHFREARQIDCE
jgi:hypothetical protein